MEFSFTIYIAQYSCIDAQIKECTNLDGEGIIAVIREADETDVLE